MSWHIGRSANSIDFYWNVWSNRRHLEGQEIGNRHHKYLSLSLYIKVSKWYIQVPESNKDLVSGCLTPLFRGILSLDVMTNSRKDNCCDNNTVIYAEAYRKVNSDWQIQISKRDKIGWGWWWFQVCSVSETGRRKGIRNNHFYFNQESVFLGAFRRVCTHHTTM